MYSCIWSSSLPRENSLLISKTKKVFLPLTRAGGRTEIDSSSQVFLFSSISLSPGEHLAAVELRFSKFLPPGMELGWK